jgi:ABC-type branched-subunit amino acid transport system substrate-binding protein
LRVGACLSLSGRYRRFGVQAAHGLAAWQELDGRADLVIEDDASNPDRLGEVFSGLAARSDLLLGPYSTQLTRRAAELASGHDLLLWNHGGAGDDVQTGHPGHLVSVLTPAGRYARPFLRLLDQLARSGSPGRLWIVEGRGSFGRQVAAGAEAEALQLGLDTMRVRSPAGVEGEQPWDLLSTGTFEDDVAALIDVMAAGRRPRLTCSVAAGVSDFQTTAAFAPGVLGLTQWVAGAGPAVEVGPEEADFVARYTALTGREPDYPAVQAAAAAALAVHLAHVAGVGTRAALWAAATGLHTTTLFGRFRADAVTGAQAGHETRLVAWTAGGKLVEPAQQAQRPVS